MPERVTNNGTHKAPVFWRELSAPKICHRLLCSVTKLLTKNVISYPSSVGQLQALRRLPGNSTSLCTSLWESLGAVWGFPSARAALHNVAHCLKKANEGKKKPARETQ